MKAMVHSRYGSPDLLQFAEVNKPAPKDNELLVAIHTTTVSTADCNMRNFTFVTQSMRPIARVMFGIRRPWKARVLGTEFAGRVEAVGRGVTRFKPGDRVFASTGMACGGHAEYTCVAETGAVAVIPDSLSFEEAVAIPFGANTALYFLQHQGRIHAGQDIAIIGASGAIGSAAVQLAKHFGATVTGVCSTANLELVTSLGADTAVDYTREDFAKKGKTYDLIFDVVGGTTFDRCQHALKANGVFLQNIMELSDVARSLWTAVSGGKKIKGGVAIGTQKSMQLIAELVAAGTLKAVIDRRYPLEDTAEAFKYVERGHKKGNVVVTVTRG
jgi:NADPH:quinone reductase-like Zn-dependent oxidoreductase